MHFLVHIYVSGCKVCHRIKEPWHARNGINMPLETPSRPWDGVTMNFVTHLPPSIASGFTGILVIVDQLTKMAIYLLCWKDMDPPERALLVFHHVICKRGVSDNIVTDRGT
jgi:hypothetical protein